MVLSNGPASLLHLLLLLLLCHNSYATTSRVTAQFINAICTKTQNPEFCLRTLNSQTTKETTTHQLLVLTLALAHDQAHLNQRVVQIMADHERNYALYYYLSHCLTDYEVASKKLKEAHKKKEYDWMAKLVEEAMKMTHKCEDDFKTTSRPSPVAKYSKKLVALCDMALATLQVLGG